MMDHKVTLFFIVAALSLTHAFHKLVPKDKELVYTYRALVRTGTQIPVSFASQFILEGHVHVQTGTNSTFVRFSDLKYYLYNGELDHVKEVEGVAPVPIPPEVEDLYKVFKIIHDDSGKAIGISTETQEKMFSRNIKKGIASILQMDVDKMDLQVAKPHAFVTEEQSIYGKGSMLYSIVPHGDMIKVHKMHEMATTRHMYRYFLTNLEPLYCEAPYEEPMSHDSQRVYKIVKRDGQHVVEHIEADGGIYMYPLRGKSEKYYLYVNQTMWLKDVTPIKDRFHVNAEHYEDDLNYYLADLSMENGAAPDITNGRRVIDSTKLIPILEKMLADTIDYLHEDHIHTKTPNIEKGQLINRLRRLLTHFDMATLEQAHNGLLSKNSERDLKALEIFHQVLPLVGTRAAAVHIKNVIVHKKVNDMTALRMLFKLPFNLKVANEKILKEMEELIRLPDTVSKMIRRAATLCFASIVHKIHEMEKHLREMHHHHHHDTVNVEKQHGDEKVYHYDHRQHHESTVHEVETPYEKYVIEFVAKIKSSDDFDEQMLYLEVLYNMKLPSVLKHLEPAVRGEWWHCHHRRLLAMWAVSPIAMQSPEKVFEMFWPILTNHHEHAELRMMSYYIMMEAHPSVSRLLNIFWFMHNERDEELYHFHYTYWQSMSTTTDPCRSKMKLNIKQLKSYMHKPVRGSSTYHQIDYHDYHTGTGGGYNGFYVKTNTSKLFAFVMNRHIFNVPVDNYVFYMKISGVSQALADKIKLDVESNTRLFTYDDYLSAIKELPNNKDVHLEVVVTKYNQIISSFYFDHTKSKALEMITKFIHEPEFSFSKETLLIEYEIFSKLMMPTDMGIPAMIDILLPSVHDIHYNISKETANKITTYRIDNHWKTWRHSRFGIAFYNPIADVWQGVNKYISFDSSLPLKMDVSVNPQQQSMKISWKRHADPREDVIGYRSHGATMVFVKDDLHNKALVASCKTCQEFTYVTRGEEYRHNYEIMNRDDSNTGYNHHVVIYDSEIYATNGTVNSILAERAAKYNKNYRTMFERVMLTLREQGSYIMLKARPGMNGYMVKLTPSTMYPVSQIDLSLRINREINRDEHVFIPGMKINTRATYMIKKDDNALKTWDATAMLEMNPGHTLNNLKMQLTRKIPGQKDFVVCLEGVKKWSLEGVTGHMNVALGQSADGKCTKDDAIVDVTMTGVKSEQQKDKHHVYGDCVYPESYEVEAHHPLSCLVAHSSVRDYVYNIKTTNVPTEYKKAFYNWLDMKKGRYLPYYQVIDEHQEEVTENNVKIKIHYPTVGDELDIKVFTPQQGFVFSSLPTEEIGWPLVQPDNLHYSKMFMFMHAIGLTFRCDIRSTTVKTGLHSVPFQVPKEWTLFIGDAAENAKHAVYIKNVDDKNLGVKIVHKEHVVEVIGHGHKYEVTVDGKKLEDDQLDHALDWVHVKAYNGKEMHHPIVTLILPYFGVHIEHDGDHVHIETPELTGSYFGQCVNAAH